MREVKEKLWQKAMGREMAGANGSYELQEPAAAYEAVFDASNADLSQKDVLFWERYL